MILDIRNHAAPSKKPLHPPRPNLSKSSIGEFDTCERRWAYRYLWYDFDYFEFPEDLKRQCQFHSKLMGNEAFAGQVVHDVIDEIFRSKKEGGLIFEDPIERAKEIALEYVSESRTFVAAYQSGSPAPKLRRQALQRLFFNEGFDGAAKAEFRKTVETALVNFLDSELKREIDSIDPAFWELPDRGGAPWFVDHGIPVYANYDFAIRQPEQTILYDWKTGKLSGPAERDVREQLHTYAAYAMDTWGVPASQIKLRAVWLTVGKDQVYESKVDEGLLVQMRREWRQRYDELARRREAARGSMERLFEVFPTTGIKKKKCRYCPFRFCEGYAEVVESTAEAT